jgi:hypothetical protein
VLTVHTQLKLKGATNPGKGDVQVFLQRLLVEVIGANYRYFLNEHLAYCNFGQSDPEQLCWPPLLAKEREVSGLFANALSTICPVSRPEHAIRRSSRDDNSDETPVDKSGRVDFLALYGSRYLGLELKRVPISTLVDITKRVRVIDQWKAVSKQSKEVMTHMRSLKSAYPNAIGLGLLVIPVSRSVATRMDSDVVRGELAQELPTWADGLKTSLKPDFLAYYKPPLEMQVMQGFGKDQKKKKVFPAVFFAAVVHGQAERVVKRPA